MEKYIDHSKSIVGLEAIGKHDGSGDPTDNVRKDRKIKIIDQYYEDGEGWMIAYNYKGKTLHSFKGFWDIQYPDHYYINE